MFDRPLKRKFRPAGGTKYPKADFDPKSMYTFSQYS